MLEDFTVNHLDSSLDWSAKAFYLYVEEVLRLEGVSSPLGGLSTNSFYSLPVKQLEIRLTVFVGHSEKKREEKKPTYLIFPVMMSILFLSVLVSQDVNVDALLIAGRRWDFYGSSVGARGSAILRDTGVIAREWPRVLPLVTRLTVTVTSRRWPFPCNYPYISPIGIVRVHSGG